jgi:hypothetical protein
MKVEVSVKVSDSKVKALDVALVQKEDTSLKDGMMLLKQT